MENQRNVILAITLMALILFGWPYALEVFYPARPATVEDVANAPRPGLDPATPGASSGAVSGTVPDTASASKIIRTRKAVLADSARVAIDAPRVGGSINLTGARIDDVVLKDYREKLDKDSDLVHLFSPAGTADQYFAQFGWIGEGVVTPTSQTVWTPSGGRLTPSTPVTLRWANPAGQRFEIVYAIDANYLISVTQRFINSGATPAIVRPLGLINRTSANADPSTWTVRNGPLGVFDDVADFDVHYDDLDENPKKLVEYGGNIDWLGFTDHYWLSALIPAPGSTGQMAGNFRSLGGKLYQSELLFDSKVVAPGKMVETKAMLFAGAKETELLDDYVDAKDIKLLDRAVDWGWFIWFEKPIFKLLNWLFEQVGNFGVAIILLTIIIRGLMFPIAQRQFASMAQMRAVQPKMKALQERYKDDKQKLQTEMMELYRKEKVNPLAGCLPMFLQIPVFFALYKVLLLAIEMRHQPFVLWIKDLSAPDPLTPVNLFGLLPFDPPSMIAIGILPIILGVTMWLQFKLNPAPMDPVQQQVFSIMPWVLMFVMAPFAAGLQLYWAMSNVLTIAQQKWLYSRHPQLKELAAQEAAAKAAKAEKDKMPKEKGGA
ncbi:MAG: membrane protein insertase YidC [Blastomonas sp.]|uniref:membrane protein insertase YidC n=1 Tax=unclassified Blastomonas TaxID=2626550 RepID=UPI00083D1D8D|nr:MULTISPECIES: membrane protein insertase YidC [unclassified Blastomonas]AOG01825.1 membrane protein insertase [Blastomonas sp. RAC04]MCO5791654.1 membrane protein insertase YidC [Blastomonas sp.]MDM7927939.1 membrane protein insertase YidC [Blastomonas fulva]